MEQAAAGNSVVITRHGTPFAELRPPGESRDEVAATARP
jgi:antitoxin (DNA-binding transcriptional repressor) of toxin-antitoxin stability system